MLCTKFSILLTSTSHLSKGLNEVGLVWCLWNFGRKPLPRTDVMDHRVTGFASDWKGPLMIIQSNPHQPSFSGCFTARCKPWWFTKLLAHQYLPWVLQGRAPSTGEHCTPQPQTPGDQPGTLTPMALVLVPPVAYRAVCVGPAVLWDGLPGGTDRSPSPSHSWSSVIVSVILSVIP